MVGMAGIEPAGFVSNGSFTGCPVSIAVYIPWWIRSESNRHFPAFETGASAELGYGSLTVKNLVALTGFEPATSGISCRRLCHIGLQGLRFEMVARLGFEPRTTGV